MLPHRSGWLKIMSSQCVISRLSWQLHLKQPTTTQYHLTERLHHRCDHQYIWQPPNSDMPLFSRMYQDCLQSWGLYDRLNFFCFSKLNKWRWTENFIWWCYIYYWWHFWPMGWCKWDSVENKPHLDTFHESILASFGTFQLIFVYTTFFKTYL